MKNQEAFLVLLRAGLWKEINENANESTNDIFFVGMDWRGVLRFAEDQSVVGLIATGLEKLPAGTLPFIEKLTLLGKCQLIEQRNTAMNQFICELVKTSIKEGVKPVLIKGQGVAQCYAKPQWRASGDVDLLYDKNDYKRATETFLPLAASQKRNERYSRHLGMTIDSWYVEIHGSLRTGLSGRVDRVVDEVQEDTFLNDRYRVWHNGETEILLPAPDNDVFFVFTHFIKHFYKEGVNLRQLCDWCRLLWVYKEGIDCLLLEKRMRKAGLMSEWKAFASLAVDALGMPIDAMPLFDNDERWHKKGERILDHVVKDRKHNKIVNTMAIERIFPWNTMCFLPSIFLNVNWLKIKERLVGR